MRDHASQEQADHVQGSGRREKRALCCCLFLGMGDPAAGGQVQGQGVRGFAAARSMIFECYGRQFDVTLASNVNDDTVTLEFCEVGSAKTGLSVAIAQFGDHGTDSLSISLFVEIDVKVLEEIIDYARDRLGVPREQ